MDAEKFSGSLFIFLLAGLITVCVVGELFMYDLVKILAPSFTEEMQNKTAHLASIMFPYLLFISASSFLGAILNAKKHFLMWTFLPIVLNLFMVFGMVLSYYNSLDITKALAFSVITAGFFQFIFIYIRIKYLNIRLIELPKISKDVKKFFRLTSEFAGSRVVQINQFVGIILAFQFQELFLAILC